MFLKSPPHIGIAPPAANLDEHQPAGGKFPIVRVGVEFVEWIHPGPGAGNVEITVGQDGGGLDGHGPERHDLGADDDADLLAPHSAGGGDGESLHVF